MLSTDKNNQRNSKIPIAGGVSGTLEDYLLSRQLSPKTIEAYKRVLNVYFTWVGSDGRESEQLTYSDLLGYIKHHQNKGQNQYYISQQLTAIRHYYSYLKYTGEIKNNPAAGLYIRGRKRTVPHDLLTAAQLEQLYQDYEPKGLSGKRNKTMLGLLVYQGLTSGELEQLEPLHLKLRQGKIEIPGTKRSHGRILKLEARQMIDLQEYTLQVRHKILDFTGKESAYLFVSIGESKRLRNSLDKLMRLLRRQYEWFTDAKQLRQSRISLWIKQYDIRQVQYMAGHKYVSSTERYQITNLEDLQKELEKHHPGGDGRQ